MADFSPASSGTAGGRDEVEQLKNELSRERARSARLADCLRSVQQQLLELAGDDEASAVSKANKMISTELASAAGASLSKPQDMSAAAMAAPGAPKQAHHAEPSDQFNSGGPSERYPEQAELNAVTPVGCAVCELRPQPALVQPGSDAGNGLAGWEIIGKLKGSSHAYPAAGTVANPFPLSQSTCSDPAVRMYGYSAPNTGVTASAWHSLPSLVLPLEPEAATADGTAGNEPLPAMAGPNTDVLVTAGGAGDASVRLWRGAAMAGLGCTTTKKHRVAGGEGLPLPAMCTMRMHTQPAVHGSGALVAPAVSAFAVSSSMGARGWAASAAAASAAGATQGGDSASEGTDPRVHSCLKHWAATKLQSAVPRLGTQAAVSPALPSAAVMRAGGGVVLTGTSSGQLLAWGMPVELYTQDLSDSGTGKPDPLVRAPTEVPHQHAFPLLPTAATTQALAHEDKSATDARMWHIGCAPGAQCSTHSAHAGAITGLVSLGEVGGHLSALAASVSKESPSAEHKQEFAGDDRTGLEEVPHSMCLAGCAPDVLAAWYRVRNCPAFVSVSEDGWLRVWALHVGDKPAASLVLSCCIAAALQERGVVGTPPCQVHATQLAVDPTSAPSLCVLVGTSTGHVVKLDILRGKWVTHGHIMSDKLAAAMKRGVAALPKALAAVEPLAELVDRVQDSREGPPYTAAVLRAGAITALAMHGSKPLLMAGTSAGWVAAFDSSSLQCQHVFLAHSCSQTALVPSPAVPLDPPPAELSAGGVHPYQSFMVAQMYSSLPYDAVVGSGVGGLVVDPTGSVLISTGAADGAVRIWDFATGALMKEFSDTHRASPLPLSAPQLRSGAAVWGAISTFGGGAAESLLHEDSKSEASTSLNLRGVESSVCRCATSVSIAPRSLYVTSQDEAAAAGAASAAGIVPMDRDAAAGNLSKLLVFSTGGADGVVKLFSARKPSAAPKFGIGGAGRSPAGGTSKAASSAGRLLASGAGRGRRKPSSAARLLSSKRAARGGAAAAASSS